MKPEPWMEASSNLRLFQIVQRALEIIQSGTSIEYLSSGKINSITYSGEGDGQFNALRLIELGEQFSIDLERHYLLFQQNLSPQLRFKFPMPQHPHHGWGPCSFLGK